jgi:Tol biopolymer transport system component
MSDLKTLLERADRAVADVPLPDGGLEALERRREHRQRNRRIRAGTVGVIVALATGIFLARSLASDRVPADRIVPPPAAAGTFAYILDGDVYVADQDGSNAIKILDGASAADCYGYSGEYWAEEGMWSPDGRYLAYRHYTDCGNPDHPKEVVISDAEGNVVTTFPTGMGWEIAWSPDSTRVAVWDDWMGGTIGVYGVDGVRQTQLKVRVLPGSDVSGDIDPMWMPDGNSLVVGNTELPLDGGTPRLLRDALDTDPFSLDGSHTAYVDEDGSLKVARSDGSEAVTLLSADSGQDLGVTGFSPRGNRILFWKTGDWSPRTSSLWSIGVDGSDPRLLVDGTMTGEWLSVVDSQTSGGLEPDPASGPSGELAYITPDGDVYVADPDGSNARMIADGRPPEDCAEHPEYWTEASFWSPFWSQGSMWSPDGRYLAYRYTDCSSSTLENHPRGVVISDAEGNVVARFPTGEGWQIAWSPDSTRVAVWDDWLGGVIGVYGLDGARQTQLNVRVLPGSDVSGDIDPMWMPDGNSLVVGNTELPLDGGTPRLLPRWFGTFSPDGSLVMYGGGQGSLMVSRPDGSEPREVVSGNATTAAWSPTGDRIAFTTSDDELRVVELATLSVTKLVADRGSDLGVSGFSPRGDRILFTMATHGEPSLWSVGLDGSDPRLVVAETTRGEWRPR